MSIKLLDKILRERYRVTDANIMTNIPTYSYKAMSGYKLKLTEVKRNKEKCIKVHIDRRKSTTEQGMILNEGVDKQLLKDISTIVSDYKVPSFRDSAGTLYLKPEALDILPGLLKMIKPFMFTDPFKA